MALKNYVNRVGPVVDADWLNFFDFEKQIPTSTGTAAALVVTYTGMTAPFVLQDGMIIRFRSHITNTGPTTINVAGSGVRSLNGRNNTVLRGGEFDLFDIVWVQYHAGINVWNLLEQTSYNFLGSRGGGVFADFVGSTLRLGGDGATWTAISMADPVTMTGADGSGILLSLSTSVASAAGNLSIANSRAGAGSNALLQLTNTIDANCDFRVSETGAATKFARIGPTVGIPLQFQTANVVQGVLESTGRFVFGATSGFGGSVRVDIFGSTTTGLQIINDTAASFAQVIWNRATAGNNAFLEFATEGSYTARGSITYNRGAGLVAYNTTSDQRLKNLVNRRAQGIDPQIDQMQIHHFSWKDTGTTGLGCYAQELIAIAPEAVTPGDDNPAQIEKAWGVDYSKLVPRLILEIQSLRRRVAALESASGSAVDDKAT